MNLILEYQDYNNLSLPKGITLTNAERIKMCKIISNAINNYYKINKYSNSDIFIDDIKINTEYISKAINNRSLLKKIISDPNQEIISGVRNKEDLFKFVEDNVYDLFNHKGKYFKYVYNLLSNTSKKGKRLESDAFNMFREVAKKKGIDVDIIEPSTREDISGIDGIFFHNKKRYTIQVKPLFKMEEYKRNPNCLIVFCDGVLKDLKTDYLIVTNKIETKIFKSKGIAVHPSFFIVPKENITE